MLSYLIGVVFNIRNYLINFEGIDFGILFWNMVFFVFYIEIMKVILLNFISDEIFLFLLKE